VTRQILFGGTSDNLVDQSTTAEFIPICNVASQNWTTTELDAEYVMPAGGTLSNLRVLIQVATVQDADALAFTLRVNGADSALTCTVGGTAGDRSCSDTSNTVSVSAGDLVTLQVVANSSFNTLGNCAWTFVWNSTTANQSILMGMTSNLPVGTNTRYMTLHGECVEQTTEPPMETLIPTGATIKNLYVHTGAPFFGTRTWTVRKNGADTGITTTTANAGQVIISDTVNTDTVVDDDEISIKCDTVGTIGGTQPHSWGLVFETDVEGEFLAGSNTNAMGTGHIKMSAGVSGEGTAGNTWNLAQYCRLIRMRARVGTAPGAGEEFTFEPARTTADTIDHRSGLRAVISDTATEDDATGEILFQDDEERSTRITETVSAASSAAQVCLLLSTAPRARGSPMLGSANPMIN
jgi:hypothetical protein